MPMKVQVPRSAVLSLLSLAVAWSMVQPAKTFAQTYTPYSYFAGLSSSDMSRIQVKLTYGGPQNVPVHTIAFAVPNNPMHLASFAPFQRSGFDYTNDQIAQKSFSVSAQELKALIDSVGTLSAITSGTADPIGAVSFALLDTVSGTTKVFESIPSTADARTLFATMLEVLGNNATASFKLTAFGCACASLPTTPPTSVDSHVSAVLSGLRADRSTKGRYVGQVKVTNTSGSPIAAPIRLVVKVIGPATVVGASGGTCNTPNYSAPYFNVSPVTALAPGASLNLKLQFMNPSADKLDVELHVLSGPGTP